MKVILATMGTAKSVILEGPASAQTIYHEDLDECAGWNPSFEADLVARWTAEALGVKVISVDVSFKFLPEKWGIEDLQRVALRTSEGVES